MNGSHFYSVQMAIAPSLHTGRLRESLTKTEKRSNWMILVGAPDWVRGVIQRLLSG
jgi:hypothetical protein